MTLNSNFIGYTEIPIIFAQIASSDATKQTDEQLYTKYYQPTKQTNKQVLVLMMIRMMCIIIICIFIQENFLTEVGSSERNNKDNNPRYYYTQKPTRKSLTLHLQRIKIPKPR